MVQWRTAHLPHKFLDPRPGHSATDMWVFDGGLFLSKGPWEPEYTRWVMCHFFSLLFSVKSVNPDGLSDSEISNCVYVDKTDETYI